MKRAAIAIGCASTEVMHYEASADEVLQGKGGAYKEVDSMRIYFDGGAPPRAFRVIAQAKTKYRTGALDGQVQRDNALAQVVAQAKQRGADAVVVIEERHGTAGCVTAPGTSTTAARATGYGRASATTTNGPAVTGAIGSHELVALFVKYQ
jgi:uncharacterized protein YbjQ (UPF0145 family)